MIRRVRLTSTGHRDLVRVIDFLADKDAKAALRAADLIDQSIKSLAQFSERGRPVSAERERELSVRFGKGAYVLQYRVDAEEVVVARIFHSLERR